MLARRSLTVAEDVRRGIKLATMGGPEPPIQGNKLSQRFLCLWMAGSSPAMENFWNLSDARHAYCLGALGTSSKSTVQGKADSHQIWRRGGKDARSAITPMRNI